MENEEKVWRYCRKKPVVVQVFGPITKEDIIHTLEGDHHASVGDYIIRGVRGEYYPIKPDIFKETYEIVESPENCPTCGHRNHDTEFCSVNDCRCYHE